MALKRRGGSARFSTNIWPGFVDAMTALLLVMMFVLTIFVIVQSVMRDRITTQDDHIEAIGDQVMALEQALGAVRSRLEAREIEFEEAAAAYAMTLTEREALIAEMRQEMLVDARTTEALRKNLSESQASLAARDLILEATRREAEETLTLLAAAEAAKAAADDESRTALSESERQAALRAVADKKLSEQENVNAEGQRQLQALNLQLADLRSRLAGLQKALDIRDSQEADSELRLEEVGKQLNLALLRAAEAEAEARRMAEDQAKDLARYRSEFFGRLAEILEGREGVTIVGDRFVFSSEVLFGTGEAVLSVEGRQQIRNVTTMLDEIAGEIPDGIDWVIRVDGHTDDQPLSGSGRYADNWELSQARALAVLRYMAGDLGFPPDRLIAAGFGEYRPVDTGTSPDARARNRRIELKLTER